VAAIAVRSRPGTERRTTAASAISVRACAAALLLLGNKRLTVRSVLKDGGGGRGGRMAAWAGMDGTGSATWLETAAKQHATFVVIHWN
jgi:hypothetical protein